MTGPRKRKEKNHHHPPGHHDDHNSNNLNHRYHQHPSNNNHIPQSTPTQHKTQPPNTNDKHKTSNNRLRCYATKRNIINTTTNNTDGCDNDRLFPSWTPYVVWLLCTLCRVSYVRQPANWWTLHPDEIFQSLEVAHTQVYGYGFRPYEFSSLSHGPATGGASSEEVSFYRQRELELGMHGMRSALYPNFYVVVSYVAATLGLSVRPFVLWKVAHAIVTSLLPLSVYHFTHVYFRSHDASCLAAILVVASTHLNVLGTHPLLNSFLSPAIFWALSCICTMVCGQRNSTSHEEQFRVGRRRKGSSLLSKLKALLPYGLNSTRKANRRMASINGELAHTRQAKPTEISSHAAHNGFALHSNGSEIQGKKSKDEAQNPTDENMSGEKNTSAGGFGAERIKRIVFNLSMFLTAEYFQETFLSGLVLAMCVYMRADAALLSTVVLVPIWRPLRAEYRRIFVCFAGACAGLLIGVLQDFWFYDELVLSPKNWARFNVFRGLAGDLFGQSSSWEYLHMLFVDNAGLCVLAASSGFALLCAVVGRIWICLSDCNRLSSSSSSDNSTNSHQRYSQQHNQQQLLNQMNDTAACIVPPVDDTNRSNQEEDDVFLPNKGAAAFRTVLLCRAIALTLSWVVLLLFYSCKAHKELRFVHNASVLMLASFAFILYSATKLVTANRLTRHHQRVLLLVLLAAYTADQWRSFPSSKDRSNKPWAYRRIWDSHDINSCLNYVGSQDDVTGVFVDSNFHSTGGYALLHKDVPLFSLFVHEFVEFDDVTSKIRLSKPSLLDRSKNISYFTIDNLSNLVSVQNAPYTVKLLIEKQRYNYFVLAKDRQFLSHGFREAFSQGTMRVMKRTFDLKQEKQLLAMASEAPIGVNGTVLKYEGDVLFRFHRFRLALERYMAAVQLDPAQPQTYQAIAACKRRLGDRSEASRWMETCTKRFGVDECSQPLRVTNINPDRQLF